MGPFPRGQRRASRRPALPGCYTLGLCRSLGETSARLSCASRSYRLRVILGSACSAPTPEKLLSDARVAIAAGETRTAEIHLKNLLQQEPANATARLLFGGVSAATGDFGAAEQSLRRAVQLGADPAVAQFYSCVR